MDIISQLAGAFNSSVVQSMFFVVKIIFALAGFIFLGFIMFMLMRTQWIRFKYLFDLVEFFTFRPYGVRRITKAWTKIQQRLQSGDETEYKLAVIEANSMLEETLKRLGILGKTFKERLSNITPTIIPNLNDVIKAHQTRDSIVHDPNFRLSLIDAQKTLDIFEEAFRSLDLI